MIRVLHISTPTTWRGGEQQVFNLVKFQLSSLDVFPSVLVPKESELGLRLKNAGINPLYFTDAGILNHKLAARIADICKKEEFDLVHTHDSHAHSAAVISCSVFGNTLPLVVHRRVDFAVSPNLASRWKYNHSSVRKIICVSEMIRKITAPSLQNPEKLKVIYSGIDAERYNNLSGENVLRKEYGIPIEMSIVGNLSALADHKDYPTFLKTAKLLIERGVKARFVIAGDGDERPSLEKLAQDLGLKEHVIFTGFRQDVPQVMKSLDVFLMTSKTEGLGTIIIEAFMAGVPVVSTDAGGIPELVQNEITGLVSRPGDTENLAASVTRVLRDIELRDKLTRRARIFAQNFSYNRTALKTLEVYREVLQ